MKSGNCLFIARAGVRRMPHALPAPLAGMGETQSRNTPKRRAFHRPPQSQVGPDQCNTHDSVVPCKIFGMKRFMSYLKLAVLQLTGIAVAAWLLNSPAPALIVGVSFVFLLFLLSLAYEIVYKRMDGVTYRLLAAAALGATMATYALLK